MLRDFAPLVVALIGVAGVVVAGVMTRRSGTDGLAVDKDDREKIRMQGEINYLSERLDKERGRTDGLETEVLECHAQRDVDREEWRRRFANQDERIEQLTATVRRLLDHHGGPDATTA